ncbi:MAG: CvpA family protein [Helicobacter sp.]|uniref:CvpA family protein n=1 Tax=Helicobacter sp. 10-6591 TaxID=2004998 RepID=UPI000DCEF753|nr:CvpA family protein [Helicobacter sp. 10-6591]MDD7567333.1 CvpA family protein [Helicobacter sp.]MDY5740560.1 CvpA family protein [Helicobacter sp.]RAX55077.1 hypothetical protein CCY97_04705 [Helicobacter sp. 10-6591]
MEHISYIDLCLFVLIVLLSVKNVYQGFIRSFSSFLGLLFGVFLATRFCKESSSVLSTYFFDLSPQINNIIAFIVVTTIVYLVSMLVGEVVARYFQNTLIKKLDKSLGLIFGFCKSFVFLSVIVYFLLQIPFLQNFSQKMQTDSFVYRLMQDFTDQILKIDAIKKSIKSLE